MTVISKSFIIGEFSLHKGGEVNEKKPNGSGKYQPSKTWDLLGEDAWFEDDETEPGRERIVDTETVEKELGIDTDPEEQGERDN